jgi:hypothetical protein
VIGRVRKLALGAAQCWMEQSTAEVVQ